MHPTAQMSTATEYVLAPSNNSGARQYCVTTSCVISSSTHAFTERANPKSHIYTGRRGSITYGCGTYGTLRLMELLYLLNSSKMSLTHTTHNVPTHLYSHSFLYSQRICSPILSSLRTRYPFTAHHQRQSFHFFNNEGQLACFLLILTVDYEICYSNSDYYQIQKYY